ncbi:hypothetical protein L5515_005499 [Caenorhabditis briggsae]|uniref:DNA2/NAM7 helicase-like C-terminal domain-containing protein n=1 Tax=Caenorhabditis briggsae TaxID=6238 RepID=A0AAE9ESX4_CAEBR|nr:hypothetical protein L5515_005499 [Caenorhabditis briggsae]
MNPCDPSSPNEAWSSSSTDSEASSPEAAFERMIEKLDAIGHDHDYLKKEEKTPGSKIPALRISSSTTKQDIRDFRSSTMPYTEAKPTDPPSSEPQSSDSPLLAISQKPMGPYAIYIIQEISGNYSTLVPHHREIAANNRPDLCMLKMTPRSKDLLNPGRLKLKNYLPGDAICVMSLCRAPGAWDSDFCMSYDGVMNSENHKFWEIGEFYLIQREFKEKELVYKMSTTVTMTKKHAFVASGCNVMCEVQRRVLRRSGLRPSVDMMAYAKIFTPSLQPESFLKGSDRNHLTRGTNSYCSGFHVYPTVTELFKLPDELNEDLKMADRIFQKYDSENPRPWEILLIAGKLGLSANLAMENKHKDFMHYARRAREFHRDENPEDPLSLESKIPPRKGRILKFRIRKENGPALQHRWCRGTFFSMNVSGKIVDMEVEHSILEPSGYVLIFASMISKNAQEQKFLRNFRKNVVVFQRIQNNLHGLKNFPNEEGFENILKTSPIKESLVVLRKGNLVQPQPAPRRKSTQSKELISSKDHSRFFGYPLTQDQEEYINTIVYSNQPATVVDSCFRGGKTSVIAISTSLLSSKEPEKIHVACATTNLATAEIVRKFLELPTWSGKAVRLVSEAARGSDPKNKTDIDFPKIWSDRLKWYLEDVEYDEESDLVISAIWHLKKHRIQIHQNSTTKLVDELDLESPPFSLFETFLQIVQPRIIFGTIAAITESLYHGMLAPVKNDIETVQFDEASRIGLHELLAIGVNLPNARFSFLGDSRQLSPFVDEDLPKFLKAVSFAELFSRTTNGFPCLNFRETFNTPKLTTDLLSHMFYQRLTQGKTIDNMKLLSAKLKNQFPIQILRFEGGDEEKVGQESTGNSLMSKNEAELTKGLVESIKKLMGSSFKIGVLTLYKGQAGRMTTLLKGIEVDFIGTVDSSHARNFDVVILLTTTSHFRKKSFFENLPRLNVALTRSRGFTFVTLNSKATLESSSWDRLLGQIPGEAHRFGWEILNALEKVERRLQYGYGYEDRSNWDRVEERIRRSEIRKRDFQMVMDHQTTRRDCGRKFPRNHHHSKPLKGYGYGSPYN